MPPSLPSSVTRQNRSRKSFMVDQERATWTKRSRIPKKNANHWPTALKRLSFLSPGRSRLRDCDLAPTHNCALWIGGADQARFVPYDAALFSSICGPLSGPGKARSSQYWLYFRPAERIG